MSWAGDVWEKTKDLGTQVWDATYGKDGFGGLDNPMAAPEKPAFQNYTINEEARAEAKKTASDRANQLGSRADAVRSRGFIKGQNQNSNELRGKQMGFLEALQRQADGSGPSVAENQLKMSTDRNMRQALAMGASGRGNAALSGQAGQRQLGVMNTEAANQAAQLRAQEMQAARGMQANALQGFRGQDIGLEQSNLNAGIQQAGQRDNMEQFYEGAKDRQLGAQSSADIAYEGMKAGNINAANQYHQGMYQADQQAQAAQSSGLMSAGSAAIAAMAMSDERMKKDVSDVKPEAVNEFFKALASKNYKFKNPAIEGASKGEKVGFMAGDVEKTELGAKLFEKGDDGLKRYDPQVMDGILAAAIKNLMEKKAG